MRPTTRLFGGHGGGGGSDRPWKVDPRFQTAKTHYSPVLKDPAWERWAQMKKDYYKGYSLNWKTFPFAFGAVVLFPAFIYSTIVYERHRGGWDKNLGGDKETFPHAMADRRVEHLKENYFINQYEIYDEPPIAVSTWKDD